MKFRLKVREEFLRAQESHGEWTHKASCTHQRMSSCCLDLGRLEFIYVGMGVRNGATGIQRKITDLASVFCFSFSCVERNFGRTMNPSIHSGVCRFGSF